MSQAHELLLPEGVSLEQAADAVAARLPIAAPGGPGAAAAPGHASVPAAVERRFLDTFDGLLRADGVTAVWSDGRLALLERDTGRELAVLGLPGPPERLVPHELPDSRMRDRLRDAADVRALLPLATVEVRTIVLAVLDDRAKTVARIVLEQPGLVAAGARRLVPLRGRARVVELRGYGSDAERARRLLGDELRWAPAGEPLVDEAPRAAGHDPAGVSAKVAVALEPGTRADAAAVAVLLRLAEVIEANLPGTFADLDAEFLHDLRVSVRRTRAVQRELKGVFGAEALARWRAEMKWLQGATGDARDMDVYVLDFEQFRTMVPPAFRADLDPLLAVLRSRRTAAHVVMEEALRSDRAAAAFTAWPTYLRGLVASPGSGRPDAERPIEAVAGERIVKVYRRMVKMGEAIGPDTPAEPYHELRKKGKELRYLLELFGLPLFDRDVVAPMVKSLKSLQDVLGRHQDREVQVNALRGLTAEVAAVPGGPEALMAMGLLVERLGADERAARAEFAERFETFAAPAQRRLVRATFTRGAL